MSESNVVTTGIVEAIRQSSTEAKQLEAIIGRLLQVLTQNGFQVSVDVGAMAQAIYNRLDQTEKQAAAVGTQLGQLEELLHTFSLITSTLELDQVLADVMDTVIRLTGAERAYLMLMDKQTNELDLAVARNWDRENIADGEAVFSRSIVNRALKEGKAILETNAQENLQDVKSIVSNNLRSILCIPLALQGRNIGALYADNRITNDVFRREQIPLLSAFGTQAAIAIENARQFGAVKHDLENVRAELKSLQIELDRGHVEKQVSEITETDYFQKLAIQANTMRKRADRTDTE